MSELEISWNELDTVVRINRLLCWKCPKLPKSIWTIWSVSHYGWAISEIVSKMFKLFRFLFVLRQSTDCIICSSLSYKTNTINIVYKKSYLAKSSLFLFDISLYFSTFDALRAIMCVHIVFKPSIFYKLSVKIKQKANIALFLVHQCRQSKRKKKKKKR